MNLINAIKNSVDLASCPACNGDGCPDCAGDGITKEGAADLLQSLARFVDRHYFPTTPRPAVATPRPAVAMENPPLERFLERHQRTANAGHHGRIARGSSKRVVRDLPSEIDAIKKEKEK